MDEAREGWKEEERADRRESLAAGELSQLTPDLTETD